MALITRAEVIARISGRGLQTAQFTEDDLTVAELRYIKPMLGDVLYSAVSAGSGDEGDYKTFTDTYIKPALAWFSLYVASDRMMVELSDRGFMRLQADNAQPMSEAQRTSFKASILDNANTFIELIRQYVIDEVANDNPLFYGLYNVDTTAISRENAFTYTSNTRRAYHLN